ncbi:MAG: cation-translocating P-type ATPase [Planctomycetota bacterium]|nr:MAG: cation-translocating P-type ATPase [Planctomycetota bacterium]
MQLRYNPNTVTLGSIARGIRRLGYRPHPWIAAAEHTRATRERRVWILRFAIAAASMMATMHLAVNLFAGDLTGDLEPHARSFFGWLSFLTCLPAVTWCAMPYHRGAVGALRARRATLDLTVSLVLLSGFTISTIHLVIGRHDVYFDAMAMFIFFLLAGRLLFIMAKDRVRGDAAALTMLVPSHARREMPDGNFRSVASQHLHPGDHISVQGGERFPADGHVISGQGTVDNAVLTGESMPLAVGLESSVRAGTLLMDGTLLCQVEAAGANTQMGKLLAHLHSDQSGPSPIAALVDRVLAWFAPVVAILATTTFLLWLQVDLSRAWEQTIAVLIVACPCALGLAAPLIQALSVNRAARQGILIRDAAIQERLTQCRHVVLDKTGTLTTGAMHVRQISFTPPQHITEIQAQTWCQSLASRSGHPASRAIASHLHHHHDSHQAPLTEVVDVPGQGIQARCGSHLLRLGTAAFAQDSNPDADPGHTVLSVDGLAVARFTLYDPPRPEAAELIALLEQQGWSITVASGDHPQAVADCARALNLNPSTCHARCSPEDKRLLVEKLENNGGVVMIGDGINDAAALQAASVGIGIRGGLQATLQVSPVFLLRPDLALIAALLRGARKSRISLRQCLVWSLIYNVGGIAAAMIGWWGPWICAIAMPTSSLTIIAIALMSRAFREPVSTFTSQTP